MRLSNTGFRPPVHDQVTPYEIPPIGPRPLVEPPLQNDDSRVRGLHGQRGGLSVKLIGRRTSTRTARPCVRPGRNRAPSTYARAAPSKPTCELSSTRDRGSGRDRKSTRLNSSHTVISYAVFCLK